MTPYTCTIPTAGRKRASQSFEDRRTESRDPVIGHLWMHDRGSARMFRCRCVDVSQHGMRLRVPLGFGIHEGQRYELRSHPPGKRSDGGGLGLVVSRWATVVRTDILVGSGADEVDVGVVLDSSRTAVTGFLDSAKAVAHA